MPYLQQAKIVQLSCFHYRIGVFLNDTPSLPVRATHLSQTKEEKLVDIHQLIGPKLVLIEDISSEQLRRDTASQVF